MSSGPHLSPQDLELKVPCRRFWWLSMGHLSGVGCPEPSNHMQVLQRWCGCGPLVERIGFEVSAKDRGKPPLGVRPRLPHSRRSGWRATHGLHRVPKACRPMTVSVDRIWWYGGVSVTGWATPHQNVKRGMGWDCPGWVSMHLPATHQCPGYGAGKTPQCKVQAHTCTSGQLCV